MNYRKLYQLLLAAGLLVSAPYACAMQKTTLSTTESMNLLLAAATASDQETSAAPTAETVSLQTNNSDNITKGTKRKYKADASSSEESDGPPHKKAKVKSKAKSLRGIQRKQYACFACKESFKLKRDLQTHLERHVEEDKASGLPQNNGAGSSSAPAQHALPISLQDQAHAAQIFYQQQAHQQAYMQYQAHMHYQQQLAQQQYLAWQNMQMQLQQQQAAAASSAPATRDDLPDAAPF